MSRSWMSSALLPSEFWWFAMKQATEVSNYIPLKLDRHLTTPHQLVYKSKVDLRNLLPMFCVPYPKYKHASSTDIQSCKAILVGRSNTTHAYMFYHLPTKNIITTASYLLDKTLTAGPAFGLHYNGGIYFNKRNEHVINTRPPTFQPDTSAYITKDNTNIHVKILSIPVTDDNLYTTVQYSNGDIYQIHEKFISTNNPNISPHQQDLPFATFPKWIQNNTKCTLFLQSMQQPSQGYLFQTGSTWTFCPGHKHHNKHVDLPSLNRTAFSLISTY